MKLENQELAQNADASTRKDLPFQEKITKLLFAAIVQQKKHYRASEFPPRNRKRSSASSTAITPNKRHTAATLPHVRRFAYPCKVMSTEWVGRKLYGLATCEVNDDWTDEDTAQLKEYLTGQYADGWGEGFEQHEIDSFTEIETCEEYDEEADEYYESEWEVRSDVYISFWQDRNFRIMTEAELKK